MSTLELDRAKFALEKINGIKAGENRDKFLIELRDLPARLHSAGLGQTIASLLASQNEHKARKAIYGWIEEWLRQPPVKYPSTSGLIDCIVGNLPGTSYMTASREARALATWLKKFAEAFIEKKD
jgi:CRISPR type III-B/RAMP module-associated protein Cmr5